MGAKVKASDSGIGPLGSKYLVGLPSGLRIDILCKGAFVPTEIV